MYKEVAYLPLYDGVCVHLMHGLEFGFIDFKDAMQMQGWHWIISPFLTRIFVQWHNLVCIVFCKSLVSAIQMMRCFTEMIDVFTRVSVLPILPFQ